MDAVYDLQIVNIVPPRDRLATHDEDSPSPNAESESESRTLYSMVIIAYLAGTIETSYIWNNNVPQRQRG